MVYVRFYCIEEGFIVRYMFLTVKNFRAVFFCCRMEALDLEILSRYML